VEDGVPDRLIGLIPQGESTLEGPSRTTHTPHTIHLRTNTPGHHRHTTTAIVSELIAEIHRLLPLPEKPWTRTDEGQTIERRVGNALPTILIVTTTPFRRTNVVEVAHHLSRTKSADRTKTEGVLAQSPLPLSPTIGNLGQLKIREPGHRDLGLLTTQWPLAVYLQNLTRTDGIDHDR
jgi:hypothetical protein